MGSEGPVTESFLWSHGRLMFISFWVLAGHSPVSGETRVPQVVSETVDTPGPSRRGTRVCRGPEEPFVGREAHRTKELDKNTSAHVSKVLG